MVYSTDLLIVSRFWLTFLHLLNNGQKLLETRDRLRRSARVSLILRYSTLLAQDRKRVGDMTAISRITTKWLRMRSRSSIAQRRWSTFKTPTVHCAWGIETIFRLSLRPCNVRTCGAFALSQCVQTITASHSRTSRENPILGGSLKKKKNITALRSPADIARFRLKSPLSPIPDVRFFSLDRFYCVTRTCSIRDSESLCPLKVTRASWLRICSFLLDV